MAVDPKYVKRQIVENLLPPFFELHQSQEEFTCVWDALLFPIMIAITARIGRLLLSKPRRRFSRLALTPADPTLQLRGPLVHETSTSAANRNGELNRRFYQTGRYRRRAGREAVQQLMDSLLSQKKCTVEDILARAKLLSDGMSAFSCSEHDIIVHACASVGRDKVSLVRDLLLRSMDATSQLCPSVLQSERSQRRLFWILYWARRSRITHPEALKNIAWRLIFLEYYTRARDVAGLAVSLTVFNVANEKLARAILQRLTELTSRNERFYHIYLYHVLQYCALSGYDCSSQLPDLVCMPLSLMPRAKYMGLWRLLSLIEMPLPEDSMRLVQRMCSKYAEAADRNDTYNVSYKTMAAFLGHQYVGSNIALNGLLIRAMALLDKGTGSFVPCDRWPNELFLGRQLRADVARQRNLQPVVLAVLGRYDWLDHSQSRVSGHAVLDMRALGKADCLLIPLRISGENSSFASVAEEMLQFEVVQELTEFFPRHLSPFDQWPV